MREVTYNAVYEYVALDDLGIWSRFGTGLLKIPFGDVRLRQSGLDKEVNGTTSTSTLHTI
jgi:hypothetical protein